MTEPITRQWVAEASKHWGRVIVVGVIDLIVGIMALVWPHATVLVLAVLIGIALLISGIASLAFGIRAKDGWTITLGVVAIIAAILFFLHPGAGLWAIALAAAFYFFVTGVADVVMGVSRADGRWLWIILGVLSIIASIILVFNPHVAVVTVALIVGISFIVRGIAEISIGFQLRSINKSVTPPVIDAR